MTVRGDDQITSRNVLVWAKRVEAQRTQVAVMSTITENKEFNKIKVSRPALASNPRTPAQYNTSSQLAFRYCGNTHPSRQCPAYGKMCMECSKVGHFCRICRSKKSRAVNEMEQEAIQENTSKDFEMVSINSVYFNKNHCVLMANLKTLVGKSSMSIPYKIDTKNDGNIRPWYIFKKLFPGVTNV